MSIIANYVKCIYCGKKFNRDSKTIPFVKVTSNRYAHQACVDAEKVGEQKEIDDKLKLNQYLRELFQLKAVTLNLGKQVENYIEEYHYTYSGIHQALIYWYEVKKHEPDIKNPTIGIVPYIYQEAHNYYYAIWLATEANKDKDIESFIPKVKVIEITPPERKIKKRKLFTFLDKEEEDE